MAMKTPTQITAEIRSFSATIVANPTPVFVRSEPIKTAKALDCFNTVASHVSSHGGRRILGWEIIEWPQVYLLAEFHAIWESPDGLLVDIARHQKNHAEILFLEDSTAKVPKVQEENRFYPLSDDPMICQHIQIERDIFQEEDPDSPTLIVTSQSLYLRAHLAFLKRSLAKKFGWPEGTSENEKATILSQASIWESKYGRRQP